MARKRKKYWSETVEVHGIEIVVHERAGSSRLHYSVTMNGERVRGPLKTSDRDLAKDRARAIAAELASAEINGTDLKTLTIGQLFEQFFKDKVPHYTDAWAKQAATRRKLFETAWGKDKRLDSIGESDVEQFTRQRQTGKIHSETSRVKRVRDGTIEADLRWLSTVFRWGHGVKVDGKRLVAENPLNGVKRPKEENPRQPVASHERYLATLAKVDEIDPMGRLRCMLTLARYTGRRARAICELRASDILWDQEAVLRTYAAVGGDEDSAKAYPRGGIYWRADSDKMNRLSISPLSGPAREALEQYLERTPSIGVDFLVSGTDVPLFPSPKNPEATIRVDSASRWLRKAEKLAGQPPLANGIWHPYRRKFAIQAKSKPIHDVADAGGWKSTETVTRIYQKSEAQGVLDVMDFIAEGE